MLYKQINQNKRNTWFVISLFIILMIVISLLISRFTIWAGIIFFVVSILYVMYVYFAATDHLMKIVGAKLLDKKNNPEIYELTEELCIAGGIPMPKIYLVPVREPNAFATGMDPQHASIALTQGLLDIMNKNELQGVIGHELSHIRNYDTRLTVITSALANFMVIAGLSLVIAGWQMTTTKLRGLISLFENLFGVALLAIGLIISVVGIPLAKLFLLLISRQREYLADAGSVYLTREPSGIISALQKLENMEQDPQKLPDSEKLKTNNLALTNLYFNFSKTGSWIRNLFSDHPPLSKRIARLKKS